MASFGVQPAAGRALVASLIAVSFSIPLSANPCDLGPVDAKIVAGSHVVALSESFVDQKLEKSQLENLVLKISQCRQTAGVQVFKLTVFASEDDRRNTLFPAKSPDLGFADWRKLYEHAAREPMISVLAFGDVVIARLLDKTGHVSQHIEGPAQNLPEILDISIESGTQPPSGFVNFFVRTDADLSQTKATEMARHLAEGLNSVDVRVKIRKDAWFIDDLMFPVGYRFDDPKPPAPPSYPAGFEIDCHFKEAEMLCTMAGKKK